MLFEIISITKIVVGLARKISMIIVRPDEKIFRLHAYSRECISLAPSH